ncbi:MAG TPA: glycosyltransferase family 39 protein [Candidatus Sulfomarinibacteraceae bacterium]|nr:glycosyltransferase family 39 protein [Candidatus Sulfomarinibacteraceae bacterium]
MHLTTRRPTWEKRILALILVLFILLGSTYALITPVFEASDELWHYPMIRHLADGNPLPVQVFDPAQAGPWKQEASQPPLYYFIGAALTFWIDTSDMEQVRRLNPHVDTGVITEDGNINLVVHDPQLSPWQGTLLAVYIVRLASVLMGAATVYFTYRIAREVAPERPELALGAAAANAFLPMFLFISGAVNNDNLAVPLSSLALLLMIGLVKRYRADSEPANSSIRRWLGLGIVIGLAVLTKEGTLGLLPLAWGTGLVVAWQIEKGRIPSQAAANPFASGLLSGLAKVLGRSLAYFAMVLGPVLLIAGWWYYRNIVLYGDWLGWNAFIAVLGQRPQSASLAQLWGERWGFLASYWGLFGGVNVPMAGWIYDVLNGVLLLSVAGFLIYAARRFGAWWRDEGRRANGSRSALAGATNTVFRFVEDHFALIVCLLFFAAVVVGLIRWATTTWSSQGRLVFTALSSLSVLFVLGVAGWMPRRPGRVATAALSAFMFVVAALAPFLWIRPAYQVAPASPPPTLKEVDVTFDGKLRLAGFDLQSDEQIRPGAQLELTLVWEVLQEMERDWSVFVHLNDPVLQTPLAQRDMYPGGGLLSTQFLEPDRQLVDRFVLTVPDTAVAPSTLELVVGLYDYGQPEVRLTAGGGEDALTLTALDLESVAGEFPNATSVNFGNELELVGFTIAPRRLQASETVELVVYWRPLRALQEDYTFFAQVLEANSESTTRWGSNDIQQPTSGWSQGSAEMVSMSLQLREDAPAGVYNVVVGAYTMDQSGDFRNLQIVRDERITMDRFLNLTPIRVE